MKGECCISSILLTCEYLFVSLNVEVDECRGWWTKYTSMLFITSSWEDPVSEWPWFSPGQAKETMTINQRRTNVGSFFLFSVRKANFGTNKTTLAPKGRKKEAVRWKWSNLSWENNSVVILRKRGNYNSRGREMDSGEGQDHDLAPVYSTFWYWF